MPQYRTQPCTTMHSGIIVLALVASVAATPILNGQHQQAGKFKTYLNNTINTINQNYPFYATWVRKFKKYALNSLNE